jgi:predicted HAD superfamily Cof-like phosphohydrolase
MSTNWTNDIAEMHEKFKAKEWFAANKHDKELMKKYLTFRFNMCLEELLEASSAANLKLSSNEDGKFFFDGDIKNLNAEEVVDGLTDLVVFSIGTLDIFGVNPNIAWDKVDKANMAKEVGVKEGRPNPFGLPDLIKPEGWIAPNHEGNHGYFSDIF